MSLQGFLIYFDNQDVALEFLFNMTFRDISHTHIPLPYHKPHVSISGFDTLLKGTLAVL